MPTTVGILTFMSVIKFKLRWVEHEINFITSGPENTELRGFENFTDKLDAGYLNYQVYQVRQENIEL